MSNTETTARAIIGGFFIFCAVLCLIYPFESGVRAPLFALANGATLATALFPLTRPGVRELLSLAAILMGIAAGWYWLSQATDEDPWSVVMLVVAVPVTFAPFLWIGVMTRNEIQYRRKGPNYLGRRVQRERVKEELREIVLQLRSAGPKFPGGEKYSRFDGELYQFFNKTWLILGRPNSCTYALKQHQDLLDTYVFRRLRRIAEIAITKHPYQCKYGEKAHELSEAAELLLQPVRIILELDPLPERCPQCKEAKPKHQADCMAALCWRCKYPTPPMLHVNLICRLRQ